MHLPSSVTQSSNNPSATRYASSSLWKRRMTDPPCKWEHYWYNFAFIILLVLVKWTLQYSMFTSSHSCIKNIIYTWSAVWKNPNICRKITKWNWPWRTGPVPAMLCNSQSKWSWTFLRPGWARSWDNENYIVKDVFLFIHGYSQRWAQYSRTTFMNAL